ncbi:glucose-6-phosphate isomerase [bacterium]
MEKNNPISQWPRLTAQLGKYQKIVNKAIMKLQKENIISRIWSKDHTIWSPYHDEITNRLGWLHIHQMMLPEIDTIENFTREVRIAGYNQALLLGMGGSSLAPEVFQKTFGVRNGFLNLSILDSTDPETVQSKLSSLDLSRSLLIVSTKSGSTVETVSFFKFFYTKVVEKVGTENAGSHFIAITDPGSNLTELAKKYGFRKVFLNNPNIGGRYSALSYFGLVPAVFIGMDLKELLLRAGEMAELCEDENVISEQGNVGFYLGIILGELAKIGRDKATFILSSEIQSFGDWVEQLIAESTGKDGKGILPVLGEEVGLPENYGDDRVFILIRLEGDRILDGRIDKLESAGFPVIRICLRDKYDLGALMFLYEMATTVTGYVLGIHPFNQPNVESAKVLAKKMVSSYLEGGSLPLDKSEIFDKNKLEEFLSCVKSGDYISIQAYIKTSDETDEVLSLLQTGLRNKYHVATTVGYGPRFLHSTGQLHKGDAGKGFFIQFTSENILDIPIPNEAGLTDSNITFGVLKAAQAVGDRQALLNEGRKVIRFHIGTSGVKTLRRYAESFV